MSMYKKAVSKHVHEDDIIWTLDIGTHCKIVSQYYCSLHRKRASALLGNNDFELSFEVTPDEKLKIVKSEFRKLEELFEEMIVENPDTVYNVINRRSQRLKALQISLFKDERYFEEAELSKCNPLQVFEDLTDFTSFHLEYYFPHDLFKDLLVRKLRYIDDEYEKIVSKLMTPSEGHQMKYYKKFLRMALQKLIGEKVDFEKFRKEYGFIGNRDLDENRFETDDKIGEKISQTISIFKDVNSIIDEIGKLESIRVKTTSDHYKIKSDLYNKSKIFGIKDRLATALADLLIETVLENEEIHYWKTRTFAYFRDAATALDLDLKTVNIEELDKKMKHYSI